MMLPGLADQFPKLKEGHCKHIRSKEMFYEIERGSDLPNYAARMYWCQHTQIPLGPDARPCEMGACTSERSCFERI
jgi:hypothetical protein